MITIPIKTAGNSTIGRHAGPRLDKDNFLLATGSAWKQEYTSEKNGKEVVGFHTHTSLSDFWKFLPSSTSRRQFVPGYSQRVEERSLRMKEEGSTVVRNPALNRQP